MKTEKENHEAAISNDINYKRAETGFKNTIIKNFKIKQLSYAKVFQQLKNYNIKPILLGFITVILVLVLLIFAIGNLKIFLNLYYILHFYHHLK